MNIVQLVTVEFEKFKKEVSWFFVMLKKLLSGLYIAFGVILVIFGFGAMSEGLVFTGLIFLAGLYPVAKLVLRQGSTRNMVLSAIGSFVVGFMALMIFLPTDSIEPSEVSSEVTVAEGSKEEEPKPELTEEEKAALAEKEAQEKREAEEEAKRQAEEEAKRVAAEEAERKEREAQEAKEKEEAFANSTIEFKHLNKGADRYAGEAVRFRGEIVQIQEDGEGSTIRLAVTQTSYGWSSNDIIMLYYPEMTEFFTDDVVTVDGYVVGDYTYTSQAGWDITVPLINAEKVY